MAVDKFPVEASHILMFARSVGDDNQIYYDADYAAGTEPGSVIAPPTFAQSSAQFDPDMVPKVATAWGLDATGSTDPDGNVLTYLWDFGDQNTGSGVQQGTIPHATAS